MNMSLFLDVSRGVLRAIIVFIWPVGNTGVAAALCSSVGSPRVARVRLWVPLCMRLDCLFVAE